MTPILKDGLTPRARALRFGQAVAVEWGQSLADICGTSTMRCFTEPRFVLCWLLRLAGDSWSAIERSTGINRVCARNGALKLGKRLLTDETLDERVMGLVRQLNEAEPVVARQTFDAQEWAELR